MDSYIFIKSFDHTSKSNLSSLREIFLPIQILILYHRTQSCNLVFLLKLFPALFDAASWHGTNQVLQSFGGFVCWAFLGELFSNFSAALVIFRAAAYEEELDSGEWSVFKTREFQELQSKRQY